MKYLDDTIIFEEKDSREELFGEMLLLIANKDYKKAELIDKYLYDIKRREIMIEQLEEADNE